MVEATGEATTGEATTEEATYTSRAWCKHTWTAGWVRHTQRRELLLTMPDSDRNRDGEAE